MQLDIRLPIGAFFSLLGVLLIISGLMADEMHLERWTIRKDGRRRRGRRGSASSSERLEEAEAEERLNGEG